MWKDTYDAGTPVTQHAVASKTLSCDLLAKIPPFECETQVSPKWVSQNPNIQQAT